MESEAESVFPLIEGESAGVVFGYGDRVFDFLCMFWCAVLLCLS